MSRFFSNRFPDLVSYVPGEQPADREYIKLNTNESPFPPTPHALERAHEAAKTANLYADPAGPALVARLAERYGLSEDQVLLSNGADEMLNYAFMTFCDGTRGAIFPDITYGFYPIFAAQNHIDYTEVPVRKDFSIDARDYFHAGKTVFLANPNAPTGLSLPLDAIREILENNPDNVVVIDEAYVDFGGESCVPLIREYDNLLVIQTFSKARSMAGARLGYALGCRELIRDLRAVKYAVNPFDISCVTMAMGLGMLEDDAIVRENCRQIAENRVRLIAEMRKLGFVLSDTATNFVLAKHPRIPGEALYLALRERGILVRHYAAPRLNDYNRITVGNAREVDRLLAAMAEILREKE